MTTGPRMTSVRSRAIERFLRPVAHQDALHALLPPAVRDGDPYNAPGRVDGSLSVVP